MICHFSISYRRYCKGCTHHALMVLGWNSAVSPCVFASLTSCACPDLECVECIFGNLPPEVFVPRKAAMLSYTFLKSAFFADVSAKTSFAAFRMPLAWLD